MDQIISKTLRGLETVEYLFLITAPLVNLDGRISSVGASARLGSLAPAHALQQSGYGARALSIMADLDRAAAAVRSAKRVVFGEMFARAPAGWEAYRRLLGLLRDRREQAVFSIADDKFDRADFLEFYRQVLPDCLAVTTVSEQLAQAIQALTSRPVLVAPEPYEGRRGSPRPVAARRHSRAFNWLARRVGMSSDISRLRLLWFGYPRNLLPLVAMLPALEKLSRRYALRLTCVTRPGLAEIEQLFTPERTHESATLRMDFLPWSPQTVESAIAACDLILIPSDYRNPVVQAKSPNRLIAGLHGGRFVVAHPLPAYEPYAQFAWIGEDLCEGLAWAIAHPREVVERIARGQAYIDHKHSPEAVARFWLDVFHPKPTGSA